MSLAAWQRAGLAMLVLGVLEQEPRHGYAVSQALEAAGLPPLKGAQLYPTLVRLDADGLVEARWEPGESGPARKTYALTPPGQEHLADLRREWAAFVAAAEALGSPPRLGPETRPTGPGGRDGAVGGVG